MRKILFAVFFLSLLAASSTVQGDIEEEKSIYQIAKENTDKFNKFLETAEIPGPLKGMLSGRIIVHIDGETISVVIKDGKVGEVISGEIDNPTTEIWVSKEFVEDISASEEPLEMVLVGLNTGKIKKKDYGAANKIKGAVGSAVLKIVNAVNPPKVSLKKEEVSGSVEELAVSPREGTYVINPATTDLRRAHIEIKSAEGTDVGKKEIKISEYSGYKSGKAPWGMEKIEASEDEGSLGVFLKIEAPEAEIESALIIIKYSKEEVDKKGLIEDSLHLKWYDEDPASDTYKEWIGLSEGEPSWVESVGIDKKAQVVWAKVSRFSVYGVAGTILKSKEKLAKGEIQVPKRTTAPPSTLAPIEPVKEEPPRGIFQRIVAFIKRLLGG
jgi:hypothetical protein